MDRAKKSTLALVGIPMLVALSSSCVQRIPQPAGGHANAPHVGWVIMSGDRDNPDRDFVCQSEPRTECVVPVDRPDERVLGHVHVYYHAAPMETRYTGAVRIGFFGQPHEVNPGLIVKPGEPPGNQSVADFVTAKPGTYVLALDIVATATQGGQAQNIREEVRVVVK